MRQIIRSDFEGAYAYGAEEVRPKGTSSLFIASVALVVGIIILVVGGLIAANSGLFKASQATPSDTSQQASNPPAQFTEPSSGSGNLGTGYNAIPDYVQQFMDIQPPVVKASGGAINLINNAEAKNVSFEKLLTFIREDDTDEEPYIFGVRMCVEFAETLHNHAEQAGIKTAIVGIKFRDEEVGHALNAFLTKDRGLVYIDCTGEGMEPFTFKELPEDQDYPVEHDKIAYIEQGKEYGVISIDKATSLQYSFYTEYVQDWQECADLVDEYNEEVARYNDEIASKVYHKNSPELESIKAREAELVEKEERIKELVDKLGNYLFDPLGIVESVMIYW